METGWFVRCFQCGKNVDLSCVQRREALTGVTTLQYWFRFTPLSYKTYGLVDMCPRCSGQVDEEHSNNRRLLGAVVVAGGVLLLGWGYSSAAIGLTGAAVSFILFSLLTRAKKMTLLPAERETDGQRS